MLNCDKYYGLKIHSFRLEIHKSVIYLTYICFNLVDILSESNLT